MPTASDESRALMKKWFGNPFNDGPPYRFLIAHGYTESAGMLFKPTRSHSVSEAEWQCIVFLCDEWDFAFDPKLP